MMSVRKMLCTSVLFIGVIATSWAGDGSSIEKAIVITPSTKKVSGEYQIGTAQVTLHQQGTNPLQVCYYKMQLKKGQPYTVWLDQASPAGADIFISETFKDSSWNYDFDMIEPCAEFEGVTIGTQTRWVVDGEHWNPMDEDEWEDDDWDDIHWNVPSSWWYYILVKGEPGSTATLKYSLGNRLPYGIPANPQVLTASEAPDPEPIELHDFITGPAYCLRATFQAGRRYYLATEGGDELGDLYFEQLPKGMTKDCSDWASPHNDSKVIMPSEDVDCVFIVKSSRVSDYDQVRASVRFRVAKVRKVKDHDPAPLAVNQPVECAPGHINAKGTGAYDSIIDEVLYSFKAKKNKRYVVETSGAATNLLMRLYDANGEIIVENRGNGSGSLDVRCAVSPAKDAEFYVGVCQDLADDDEDEPSYLPVKLVVSEVVAEDGDPDEFDADDDTYKGANLLTVLPGHRNDDPSQIDEVGHGWHRLNRTDWYDVFAIQGRKNMTYLLRSKAQDPKNDKGRKLTAEVFTMSGSNEKAVTTFDLTPENIESGHFTATEDATYYLRLGVTDGIGLDYQSFRVHAIGCQFDARTNEVAIAQLTVRAQGTDAATWSLVSDGKVEKTKYPNGASILLPADGTYAVRFYDVKGYSKPNDASFSFTGACDRVIVDTAYYSDTSDPKDDKLTGSTVYAGKTVKYAPTSWSLKTTATQQSRTLWSSDPADWFKFAAKDGYYYDFAFVARTGDADAVLSLYDANSNPVQDASGVAVVGVDEIVRLGLANGTYYLKVSHRDEMSKGDGSYVLAGSYANVGAIKFSKASVASKDTATSVKLTVNRTAKDGLVRVRYSTVEGTAKANEQFIPQEGILEWADKDSKAKTVEIKLIPKALSVKMPDMSFKVELKPEPGDYVPVITVPMCEVVLKNSGKYADAAAAYAAANKTKKASVTKDETAPLRAGTYFGIAAAATDLTNGLPALASVTLTVSAKNADNPSNDTVSAKVALAGKTYSFKTAKGESPWDEILTSGICRKKLVMTQKFGTTTVTNVLLVSVQDGPTHDWKSARGEVKLTMNVPDPKGKGYQKDVGYEGEIFRQNAKINDYLDKAYLFAGYYTVSLVRMEATRTSGAAADEAAGLPSGNGYLTITVDNKGGVKVAGLLADNTKVSASATACGIFEDGSSALGWKMLVPVYLAKSPYCFGGRLELTAQADDSGRLDGKMYKVVIDTGNSSILWNNDNAALTYDGFEGWRMRISPVGGWYDKVVNLQAYYNDWAQQFDIDTITAEGFPKEVLADGYSFVTESGAQVDGLDVNLAGNAFTMAKKSLVKCADNKSLNDFDASVNPCNVQVKLARATGIVTGSCSVWSENGTAQKEITGFKHNGVITLDRDDEATAVLDEDVISAGFLNKSIRIDKRNWLFSVPFHIESREK